ncbi:unnamed protein product [Mytilus coruscus]|uniref:Uncharacterized protein n=1 Tax=Mytilus coruscus TaxID=42192 RepID=A0A6J8BFM4_MYTCO|nr:unnamed protein product [Mytilus coruscus]
MLKSVQDNQKKQDDKLDYLNVNDENEYDNYDEENDDLDLQPLAQKARSDDNNNNVQGTTKDSEQSVGKSRFATMSKRFKRKELTRENIDETLAENITDLFRNGMDKSKYVSLVRPTLEYSSATCDKKMQNIERSVVKAAVLLSKTVNKYIEDCSKIANRIHFERGSSRSRGRFGRGGRVRYGCGRGRGRGFCSGSYESHSRQDFASTSNDTGAKNFPRRGGSRGFRKM